MRKVVFDIDDTAWGLNDRVCSMLSIDINNILDFYIKNNNRLSESQQKSLLDSYSDYKVFENIKWYDGFTSIFDLEKFNCYVFINSNCSTLDVKNTKLVELVDKLHFPSDRIILNIISDSKNKRLDDDIYIFVDDSPFNIAKSNAVYNIALRKPWNTSDIGVETIGNKKVIYCDTFVEILEVVEKLLCGADGYERYINTN